MKPFFALSRLFAFLVLGLLLCSCGGSSSSVDAPSVEVESPEEGSRFAAGDSLNLQLRVSNFTLGAPGDVLPEDTSTQKGQLARAATLRHHPEGDSSTHEHDDHTGIQEEDEAAHSHDHEESTEPESSHDTHEDSHAEDADHHHEDEEPSAIVARQGHMHIYLDDGMGSDAHVTAWTANPVVVLPADLAPGFHSLRFELRDDQHAPIGSEFDHYFYFEVE